MADDVSQERTEQPTPKRREEARKEGRIARSRDLGAALVLVGALGIMAFWAPWAAVLSQHLLRSGLQDLAPGQLHPASLLQLWLRVGRSLALVLGPFLGSLLFVSLAANFIQGGWLFSPQRLAPDFSRLNPLVGLKKLCSGTTLVELGKALVKVMIIGLVAYVSLRPLVAHLPALVLAETAHLGGFLNQQAIGVAWPILLGLLGAGGLDYLLQRFRFERGLRMTKQEVKEELRQTEGDPRVRARLRSLMRQVTTKRMMAQVPQADVVITNPTHVAVALKYDGAVMVAPRVVAKGQGFVALKIMALAHEAKIPMVQNIALARALYKAVEVGDFIPTSLYRAVAEVLAYVYSLRVAAGGGR